MTPQIKKVMAQKRKLPPNQKNGDAKRQKMLNARSIKVQSTDQAFSNGDLNVIKFVKAREFEIEALQNAIRSSSHALRSRAFQQVPRDMRRRTASHNVKKVPQRIRSRAAREMAMDNTLIKKRKRILPRQRMRIETIRRIEAITRQLKEAKRKKKKQEREKAAEDEVTMTSDPSRESLLAPSDTKIPVRPPNSKSRPAILSTPPVPKSKFRKRQRDKAWLPTHIFHAKRAHMTPPKEPLWGFAVPLTPTEKVHRKTHRATTLRGTIAWDTSYTSTLELRGEMKSLVGLLTVLGLGSTEDDTHIWGQRGAKWIRGSRSWSGWLYKRQMYPDQAICPTTILWRPMMQQDPATTGLHHHGPQSYPIRTVWIRCHPSSFMDLWEEIIRLAKVQKPSVKVEDLRYEIASLEITGPNATEALNGILWPVQESDGSAAEIVATTWRSIAFLSNTNLLPKNVLVPLDISDPRLHYPPRTVPSISNNDPARLIETCANWPLETTSTAAPVSLFDRQVRQHTSKCLPSQSSMDKRRAKAPAGEYPAGLKDDPKIPVLIYTTDNGNGNQGSWTVMLPWKCLLPTWSCLMHYGVSTGGNVRFGGIQESRQIAFESKRPWFPGDFPGTSAGMAWHRRETASAQAAWLRRPKGRRTEFESVNLGAGQIGELGSGWTCDWTYLLPNTRLAHLPASVAAQVLNKSAPHASVPDGAVFCASISMVYRAFPRHAARVYRLPTTDFVLRASWLAQLPRSARNKAASFAGRPKPGEPRYPRVPGPLDLVGFVTTGNFNLAEGKGSGIACISIKRLLAESENAVSAGRSCQASTGHAAWARYFIIRDSGHTTGYLAHWALV